MADAEKAVAAALGTPLPEEDAGVFSGHGDTIQFSHTYGICKQHDFTFTSNGQEMFKGHNTTFKFQSGICACWECLGWAQPVTRSYDINTTAGQKAFGFTIKSGFCDFIVHDVTDASGAVLGHIRQPSIMQRISEMWRNRMNIVLRCVDVTGHERWTLRRPGSCGESCLPPACADICAYKAPAVGLCDYCDGRDCFIDCDCSRYDLGDCCGYCDVGAGPCCKCYSCRDLCDTLCKEQCDICCANPGVHCCDCNCYPWAKCTEDMDCPQCGPMCSMCKCCEPGDCCGCQCKDCEICCRPWCDYFLWCCTCQCRRPGCKCPKCKVKWCKLCKCTNCCANCKLMCSLQCAECKRACCECPDCKARCSTCYSKCKPQCVLECEKCKKCIPQCFIACKVCCKMCPRRCKIACCGGKPVHIELDFYGPDGTPDVAVGKICYDGFTGVAFPARSGPPRPPMYVPYEFQVTLRPGYVCTITIPATSPYYEFYHKKNRGCDYHDLAMLTSLAMWYDFYCVAPMEWVQCVEKPELTAIEAQPAYHIKAVWPAFTGNPINAYLDMLGLGAFKSMIPDFGKLAALMPPSVGKTGGGATVEINA